MSDAGQPYGMIIQTPTFQAALDIVGQMMVLSSARYYHITATSDLIAESIRARIGASLTETFDGTRTCVADTIQILAFEPATERLLSSNARSIHIALNPMAKWPLGIAIPKTVDPLGELAYARRNGRPVRLVGCGTPPYFILEILQSLTVQSASFHFFFKDLARRIVTSQRFFPALGALLVYEVGALESQHQ